MHPDRRVPPFLLPVLVLLGPDGGVAVVHGGDGSPPEPHHTQALPLSRLGWEPSSARCSSCRSSSLSLSRSSRVNAHPCPSPRSPCPSGGHLSGIHQGKRIWNTKLVSMYSSGSIMYNTSTSFTIYAGMLHMQRERN